MNYTAQIPRRKHYRSHSLKVINNPEFYHPETKARMMETGLTLEDFELANLRRHWCACSRILLTKIKLLWESGGEVLSQIRIARAAKAHPQTVKKALAYTAEEIQEGLRQCFMYVQNISKRRGDQASIEQVLRTDLKNVDCMNSVNVVDSVHEPIYAKKSPGLRAMERAKMSTSPNDNRTHQRYQRSEEAFQNKQPTYRENKNAERSVRLTPIEIQLLNQKTEHPNLYEAEKRRLQGLFSNRSAAFGSSASPHSAAPPQTFTGPPKYVRPPDFEPVEGCTSVDLEMHYNFCVQKGVRVGGCRVCPLKIDVQPLLE